MEKQMIKRESAGRIELMGNKSLTATVKKFYVPTNTPDQVTGLFMSVCQRYQLFPFSNEIYLIPSKGRHSIYISRDGYLKLAKQDPDYLGIQSGVIREGEEFDIISGEVTQKRNWKKPGEIVAGYAILRRRSVPDIIEYAEMDEYFKPGNDTWAKYKSAMIIKVAERNVLKKIYSADFQISGYRVIDQIADHFNDEAEEIYEPIVNPKTGEVIDAEFKATPISETPEKEEKKEERDPKKAEKVENNTENNKKCSNCGRSDCDLTSDLSGKLFCNDCFDEF